MFTVYFVDQDSMPYCLPCKEDVEDNTDEILFREHRVRFNDPTTCVSCGERVDHDAYTPAERTFRSAAYL